MANRIIDTGIRPAWSNKVVHTTGTNFIPVTGPISTAMVKTVRWSQYGESNSGTAVVRLGFQMSDDGIHWSATKTALGSFLSGTEWKYNTSSAQPVSTDLRLFVRFGLVCANSTGGGTDVEHCASRLILEIEPTSGFTQSVERVAVWSDGTTTAIFHAMTQSVPIERVGEIRGTVEMVGDSGDAECQPAYQVSNDGITWDSGGSGAAEDSFGVFGTNLTADGKSYGTTFTTFAPVVKKQHVRFGVACKNGTGGVPEAALASLRVDVRLV